MFPDFPDFVFSPTAVDVPPKICIWENGTEDAVEVEVLRATVDAQVDASKVR